MLHQKTNLDLQHTSSTRTVINVNAPVPVAEPVVQSPVSPAPAKQLGEGAQNTPMPVAATPGTEPPQSA